MDGLMFRVISVIVPIAAGVACGLWMHRPTVTEPRWKREYAWQMKVIADTKAANAQFDISTWR